MVDRFLSAAAKGCLSHRLEKKIGLIGALLACALAASESAHAGVVRFDVHSVEIAFGGRTFGSVGEYEFVRATAYFEVDPQTPINQRIAGIDKAPLTVNGTVAFDTDVIVLRPKDASKGNGRLIYEPINRGSNPAAIVNLNSGEGFDPRSPAFAGNGFLMRRGYTLVIAGWQAPYPDPNPGFTELGLRSRLPHQDGLTSLGARYPIMRERDGAPIVRMNREQFFELGDSDTLTTYLTYPASDLTAPATLYVREREHDARGAVPREHWEYVDEWKISIDRKAIGGGPAAIWEFVYPAQDSLIYGLALASMRDLVSWLRHDSDALNPVSRMSIHTFLGAGASQTGRVMKELVHEFPGDEQGRRLFDGVAIIISGSGRNAINRAFARPGIRVTQHGFSGVEGDDFPFTYAATSDALQPDKRAGILDRCRQEGTCPKIIHVDSELEIWQGGYLNYVSTAAEHVDMPNDVRMYVFTGTEHGAASGSAAANCSVPAPARTDYRPLLRALFVRLDEWASNGSTPPPSRYPSVDDGTLATLERAAQSFPSIPKISFPTVIGRHYLYDMSTEPPRPLAAYPVLAPTYDEDGYMRAGIRHPFVTAALATQTGWNIRKPEAGAGDLCISGMSVPFPVDEQMREERGDPRRSIETRYRTAADYVAAVRAAASDLRDEGLLLSEDLERIVGLAASEYEAAVSTGE